MIFQRLSLKQLHHQQHRPCDDCGSVSSTLTAATHSSYKKNQKKPRKTVRFNAHIETIDTPVDPQGDVYDHDDHECCQYYSEHEYQYFRSSSQAMAKVAQTQQSLNGPYRQTVERLFQECNSSERLSPTLQQELQALSSSYPNSSLLGLERMSIRALYRAKLVKREEMMDRIYDIQQGILMGEHGENVAADRIRKECEQISHSSGQFARELAKLLACSIEGATSSWYHLFRQPI